MGKYLDYNGVKYLWQQLKNRLLPAGGTSGQVLAKSSNTNYDVGWITPSGGGGAVTGVKGNMESSYRTGNVNLTGLNLGLGAATAIKTSSSSTPTSNTKAALNSITSTSSNLFALSKNGIQCKRAGYVIITGGWYAHNISSGGGAILIYKNTSSQGEFVQSVANGVGVAAPVFPPRVISVAADDVIYLYWRSTNSGTCDANRVWLTVQYVA
jgi:hypothetical protein